MIIYFCFRSAAYFKVPENDCKKLYWKLQNKYATQMKAQQTRDLIITITIYLTNVLKRSDYNRLIQPTIYIIIVFQMQEIGDHRLISILTSSKNFRQDHNTSIWLSTVNKSKVEKLFKVYKFIEKPTVALKWLLLVHYLMLEEFRGNDWFAQQVFKTQVFLIAQESIQKNRQSHIESQKIKSIFDCYFQYLKKRVLVQNYFLWDCESQECDPKVKRITDSFSLVNIIKAGAVFRNDLFFFGRYAKEKYGLIEDLNIQIGKDIKELYNILSENIDYLWNEYKQLDDQSKKSVDVLLDQIQILNEELNIIYYNTYYYRSLRPHLPNWIKIQRTTSGFNLNKIRKSQSFKESEAVQKILTLRKRILSFDETCQSPLQDTWDDLDSVDLSSYPMMSRRGISPLLEEIAEHFNDSVY